MALRYERRDSAESVEDWPLFCFPLYARVFRTDLTMVYVYDDLGDFQ